ncbi:MAG: sigma-70 family RNA polymerase sigma factor [Pseudohongiellaceae bacterium]
MSAAGQLEHVFRHEYGKLVAMLSRRVGVQSIEAVEDAVQSALMSGLEAWTKTGIPDNPTAWLFRVAHNNLISECRQRANRLQILEQSAEEPLVTARDFDTDHSLAGEVNDDLLRMLFTCCDEAIPTESQLVLALKVLCGFSIGEIAHRLFASEANVYKRLGRARSRLQQMPNLTGELNNHHYASRLPAVHKILYLLFTEGHLSSHTETAIRKELCDEAIRLTLILAQHPVGQTPQTCALLALMHLHRARMNARQDGTGALVLLEQQDRALWDKHHIATGLAWLAKSAEGSQFSRYHAEAGIAAEHCLAASLEETRWDRVVACYALLERSAPSPIHTLNRAVAVAEWKGAAAGLAILNALETPPWLEASYLWAAVMADLHQRCGHVDIAARYQTAALKGSPTSAIRTLLQRRFEDSKHTKSDS